MPWSSTLSLPSHIRTLQDGVGTVWPSPTFSQLPLSKRHPEGWAWWYTEHSGGEGGKIRSSRLSSVTKQIQGQPGELETCHKRTLAAKRKIFPRGSVNTRLFDLGYVWEMVFMGTEAGAGGREEKERTLPCGTTTGKS